MKDYLINILSALSRLLNAVCGGSPDMTFSARCYFYGPDVAEKAVNLLFLPFDRDFDHCVNAAQYDIDAAHKLLEEFAEYEVS